MIDPKTLKSKGCTPCARKSQARKEAAEKRRLLMKQKKK